MQTSYVLMTVDTGSEDEVLALVRKIDAVEEAYMVYGVYDIVVKLKANTMDRLKEIISWQVRRLDKVRSTTTMVVNREKT